MITLFTTAQFAPTELDLDWVSVAGKDKLYGLAADGVYVLEPDETETAEEVEVTVTTGSLALGAEFNIPHLGVQMLGGYSLQASTVTREQSRSVINGPYVATLRAGAPLVEQPPPDPLVFVPPSDTEDWIELPLETRNVASRYQISLSGRSLSIDSFVADIEPVIRRQA